jgi:hypothetical protein
MVSHKKICMGISHRTWNPMGNSHTNLLLINHWTNCNQTLVEWSLGWPPSKDVSGDPDIQPRCPPS